MCLWVEVLGQSSASFGWLQHGTSLPLGCPNAHPMRWIHGWGVQSKLPIRLWHWTGSCLGSLLSAPAQPSTHDTNHASLTHCSPVLLQGDDTWIQRLELETVSGAKGTAGMERSATAMKKVVVDERDLILARWVRGRASQGRQACMCDRIGERKGCRPAGVSALSCRMPWSQCSQCNWLMRGRAGVYR